MSETTRLDPRAIINIIEMWSDGCYEPDPAKRAELRAAGALPDLELETMDAIIGQLLGHVEAQRLDHGELIELVRDLSDELSRWRRLFDGRAPTSLDADGKPTVTVEDAGRWLAVLVEAGRGKS